MAQPAPLPAIVQTQGRVFHFFCSYSRPESRISAPDGYGCDVSMQRAYRIRKSGQFQYVFRKGKSMGCREMSLTYVRAGRMQVGFSVSKKVGNAVTRNRVKRRMRECFRLQMHTLKNGFYVFAARPAAADAAYRQIEHAMNGLLRRQGLYRDAQ